MWWGRGVRHVGRHVERDTSEAEALQKGGWGGGGAWEEWCWGYGWRLDGKVVGLRKELLYSERLIVAITQHIRNGCPGCRV